ncbi:MAG TPA: RNA polymerase sigma-70 factor, partial [Puia sp.]
VEKELLLSISEGDETAFRNLYDLYRNRVFSIACKLTATESLAEDIVQDVFIKIWVHRQRLAELDCFDAYLNVITRNHIFNHLRKVANEAVLLRELRVSESMEHDGFSTIVYHELREHLEKAVAHLPPQQKRVYQLSRLDGMKHREISAMLRISPSTVKSHMVEALKFIKTYLHHISLIVIFFFS